MDLRILFLIVTIMGLLLSTRPLFASISINTQDPGVQGERAIDTAQGITIATTNNGSSCHETMFLADNETNTPLLANKDWRKYLIISISLVILVLVIFSLLYYIDRWRKAPIKRNIFVEFGYHANRLIAWLFSVNGLFIILVFAVLWLVYFMVTNASALSNDGGNSVLQLLTVTLTVALSTLIPTLVSRMTSRNQLQEIVDQKIESEIQKYKTSLNEIRKDKGHSCRMSATLLEQWAHSYKESNQTIIATEYAAWSIGWASNAITQYLLIQQQYENARKNSAFCLNIIIKAANDISEEAQNVNVKFSDFQSLITMHALVNYYNLLSLLQSEANKMREKDTLSSNANGNVIGEASEKNLDATIKELETWFLKHLNPADKASIRVGFCKITGMSKEFNDELDPYISEIIGQYNTSKKQNAEQKSTKKRRAAKNKSYSSNSDTL